MWMGDGTYRLAGSLVTLIGQLEAAYPDREWQTSDGTGTIGDAAHRSEGSASDHNPWLASTVRALDVAKTANGPDCEALFRMVNKMYGARDPRVFPYGYAIFNGRITDWGNPGGFHAQVGDQHLEHVHISVGQTGYNATEPWPIPGTTPNLLEALMEIDPNSDEYKRLVNDIGFNVLHVQKITLAPGNQATVAQLLKNDWQVGHADLEVDKADAAKDNPA